MNPENYVSGLLKSESKGLRLGLSGISSKNGFDLNYRILDNALSTPRTKKVAAGYVEKKRNIMPTIIKINVLIALLIWAILYITDYPLMGTFAFAIVNASIMPIFIKVVLEFWHIYPDLETRQWHACEHKSAEFIERNLLNRTDSSFESFQKCSPVHIYCGTVYASLGALWMLVAYPAIVIPILFFEKFLEASSYTFLSTALLWISVMLMLGKAIREMISTTLDRRRFVLLLPAFIIPLLLEHFFCLAEPTEDKLKISYQESLNIIDELKKESELLAG